jgi:hypothetical protein
VPAWILTGAADAVQRLRSLPRPSAAETSEALAGSAAIGAVIARSGPPPLSTEEKTINIDVVWDPGDSWAKIRESILRQAAAQRAGILQLARTRTESVARRGGEENHYSDPVQRPFGGITA